MTTIVKSNGRNTFLNELPSLFDDFFTKEFKTFNPKPAAIFPSVNVKENENNYELELAMPGLEKSDFKIELNGNILSISAEKEISKEENNTDQKFLRKEFSHQSFKRSFSLPERTIDSENISANYSNGILNIMIPKISREKIETSRQIAIN